MTPCGLTALSRSLLRLERRVGIARLLGLRVPVAVRLVVGVTVVQVVQLLLGPKYSFVL